MKARRGAHTVYRLAYDFVWIPRYRRKVLREEVADWLDELIREICAGRDREIEALAVEIDRVHLFVSCPPRDAPAKVMNVLKSITARELYEESPLATIALRREAVGRWVLCWLGWGSCYL